MKNKLCTYQYKTKEGYCYGQFKIYQAKNGFIYIQMGIACTQLTYNQIDDLGIHVYGLEGFDLDEFNNAYKISVPI